MDYTGFIKMLFVIAGLLGILLLFSEIYEFIRYLYYRKYMYRSLNNIWTMMEESNSDNEESIYKIKYLLYEECKKLYKQYVTNNKYLRDVFASPTDLMTKFLTVAKGKETNNNMKFEILYKESKEEEIRNDIQRYEGEKPEAKIKLFEKVSFGVTVIGIVVTIISFFI